MPRSTDLQGHPAPEFDLESTQGPIRLRDLRGRRVVLFFYPKADTPGCTTETCAFRDRAEEFSAREVTVLGISKDTLAAQRRFAEKYGVMFPLLADPDRAVCEAYGVMVEKTRYGRTGIGIERTTFVIGPDGIVERVYPGVKVDGHVDRVFADSASQSTDS